MLVSPRRLGVLAAGAALAVAAVSALTLPATAVSAPAPTVVVHGTLLVVQPDRPGAATRYGVALPDGDIVPVRGRFPANARTGARFSGRLAVPTTIRETLAARGVTGPAAALRLVDQRSLTLAVVGRPAVTEVARATTPTTHQQFVAAVDNEGDLGEDDTQLLGHVSDVGAYWKGQANGAIAQIAVPSTVTHYDTTVSSADCGLGNDFFTVVQEAAQQFPGFTFSGPDQLVVFIPPDCQTGSTVGEGTVGSSFASGGALLVKAEDSIEGVYAHETGHNYGFEHANVRHDGTSLEYYGVYDVMGFALPGQYNQLTALSTPYRVFQHITDPGEITKVSLGDLHKAVRTTATIEPRSDDSGVRSVRVVDPDTGEKLYLDYRSGTGVDNGAYYDADGGNALAYSSTGSFIYARGVLVTAARAGSGTDILEVDKAGDTSLAAGKSWTNASGSLRVTVVHLGTAAKVRVVYTPSSGTIHPAPRPRLRGTPHIGRRLHVTSKPWMAGVSLHYRWLVAGHRVASGTHAWYVPKPKDVGRRITVQVTGSLAPYPTVTKTSAPSRPVARR